MGSAYFYLDTASKEAYRTIILQNNKWSGSNSGVECQLPKLDVAGSNPVSRSSVVRLTLARLNSDGNLSYRALRD
jgi:hypothetical protein